MAKSLPTGYAKEITCPYFQAYYVACRDNADREERMAQAFEVVDPSCPELGIDWKAPINHSASRSGWEMLCRIFDVTFEEICESVAFFTATPARVNSRWIKGPGYSWEWITIEAAGYRAGPAGDH